MDRFTLIHTADVHLGLSGESFAGRGSDHRRLLREAFERVVDCCLEQPTDLLLVAGDLFDSPQPGRRTVESVLGHFLRLGRVDHPVEVVLLPGSHDRLREEGIYAEWLAEGLPENVHILADPRGAPVALAGGEVLVHGGPGCLRLAAEDGVSFNVGAIHAPLQLGNLMSSAEPVLTPRDIADTRMDYLALGHWHRFGDYSTGGVTALYSGAPEITALDQAERGQAVRVELSQGGLARYERLPLGRLRREQLEVNLADFDTQYQLAEDLRRRAEAELILDVTLAGLADPSFRYDAGELEDLLSSDFFRVRITDEGELAAAEITESRYPEELVVGRFVRLMEDRLQRAAASGAAEQTQLERQALQLGLALLERKEAL
ncbi:MAG TPA: DNA repair exonuclease [Armatimonadota bacterium]|jgi:DNA repair exonuclease SbcCD nuclease subunit